MAKRYRSRIPKGETELALVQRHVREGAELIARQLGLRLGDGEDVPQSASMPTF